MAKKTSKGVEVSFETGDGKTQTQTVDKVLVAVNPYRAPNIFIVYVADAPEAARFYGDLFDMKPIFETPTYISFDLGGGVTGGSRIDALSGESHVSSLRAKACAKRSRSPASMPAASGYSSANAARSSSDTACTHASRLSSSTETTM